MIFTFGTATMLLLSTTAVVLGLFVVEPAIHFIKGWEKADQEERYMLEKEFYLASTVVVIILAIRLFAIPLYFWTMQDLVPMIPGAMCLWGVFNAQPILCWSSLILKLFLPAVFLGWIIVYGVNNACKRNPLMKGLTLFFLALLPLLVLDSVMDLSIFLSLNPIRVVCCTNAIDAWPRVATSMMGGIQGQYLLLLSFYLSGISLAITSYYSLKSKRLAGLSLMITPIVLLVTSVATIDVFTPFILHTPLHFCPFCLFFQSPVSVLFVVFIWLGASSPWWSLLTGVFSRSSGDAMEIGGIIQGRLWSTSSYSTILGLMVVTLLLIFSMMI